MITPDTRCKRSDTIVHRQIGSEAILVPIRGDAVDLESIYTLNEVGRRIWHLLDGRRTVAQLCGAIMAEFEVDADAAQRDVQDFLEELIALKAVEVCEG